MGMDSKIDVMTTDGFVELETEIRDRLSGQVHDLHIVVTSEGIILRGCARTHHTQQLAAEVVEKHSSLPIVANQIEVL